MRHFTVLLAISTILGCLGCTTDLDDAFRSGGRNLKFDAGGPNNGAPDDSGTAQPTCARDDDCQRRDCPKGTFVDDTGESTECTGCATGTYSDGKNAAKCERWTECVPGEFVAVQGSSERNQQCESCPEGQVSAGTNAGACVAADACPGGTREIAPKDGDKPPECVPCEVGTYCAGGSSLPHPCDADTWDHDGDASTTCAPKTICAAGKFVAEHGTVSTDRLCADCAAGSFSLKTNADACQPWTDCDPGSFVENAGSSTLDRSCATCASGMFASGANQGQCTPWTTCAPGQFVAASGNAKQDQVCDLCTAGASSASANAQSCVENGACPAGTRQTAPGTDVTPPDCEACPAGGYCAGGKAPPLACPPGTWDHDGDPATACTSHTACLAGSFIQVDGDNLSDRKCAPCPNGFFSTTTNAPECQAWQQCDAGTYLQATGSTTSDVVCVGCSSGTFTAAPDSTSCAAWSTCQPGEFVAVTGSASSDRVCAACPSGQYSQSINAGACVAADQCAPGTVEVTPATGTAPAECDACSAGSYCAGGHTTQVACAAGSWDNDLDPATPCVAKTDCAAGHYVASEGTTTTNRTCGACATGKFSATTNATSCQSWQTCSAGKYVEAAGTSINDRVCTDCPSGKYSSSTNSPNCTTWTTCAAPSYYMTNTPSATTNRQCAACTPPEVTSADNDASCSVPAFQMSGGTVVMEAEHYHAKTTNGSSDSWYELYISGISGNKCLEIGPDDDTVWTSNPQNSAPRLDYYVNFTSTGTFYLFVRGDAGLKSISTSDTCHAGVDNTPIGTFYDFDDYGGTWGWRVQTVNVNTTGIHTVSIWGREDGFRIDKIVVSTSSSPPSGNGPSESPTN